MTDIILFSYDSNEDMAEYYFMHGGVHNILKALKSFSNFNDFRLNQFYGEGFMEKIENQEFESVLNFTKYIEDLLLTPDDLFFLKLHCSFENERITLFIDDNNEFVVRFFKPFDTAADLIFSNFLSHLFHPSWLDNSMSLLLKKVQVKPNEFVMTNLELEISNVFSTFSEYECWYHENV